MGFAKRVMDIGNLPEPLDALVAREPEIRVGDGERVDTYLFSFRRLRVQQPSGMPGTTGAATWNLLIRRYRITLAPTGLRPTASSRQHPRPIFSFEFSATCTDGSLHDLWDRFRCRRALSRFDDAIAHAARYRALASWESNDARLLRSSVRRNRVQSDALAGKSDFPEATGFEMSAGAGNRSKG